MWLGNLSRCRRSSRDSCHVRGGFGDGNRRRRSLGAGGCRTRETRAELRCRRRRLSRQCRGGSGRRCHHRLRSSHEHADNYSQRKRHRRGRHNEDCADAVAPRITIHCLSVGPDNTMHMSPPTLRLLGASQSRCVPKTVDPYRRALQCLPVDGSGGPAWGRQCTEPANNLAVSAWSGLSWPSMQLKRSLQFHC